MIEIVTGSAAHDNVVAMPSNVLIYGAPGTMKTTDACQAFTKDGKCTAFYIPCEDGALKSVAARGLPVPDHPKETVKSWQALQETIKWLSEHRASYSACVIDSISTLSMYMYKEFEDKFKGSKNKFAIPTEMRAALFNLREWIRMIGLHSVFIAHPLAPVVLDGVFYLGGPAMAPKTMMDSYFGLLDTVLRVDYLNTPGQPPRRVYFTGGETFPELGGLSIPPSDMRAWRVKNREGVNWAVVPADLGAFLRMRNPPYAGL